MCCDFISSALTYALYNTLVYVSTCDPWRPKFIYNIKCGVYELDKPMCTSNARWKWKQFSELVIPISCCCCCVQIVTGCLSRLAFLDQIASTSLYFDNRHTNSKIHENRRTCKRVKVNIVNLSSILVKCSLVRRLPIDSSSNICVFPPFFTKESRSHSPEIGAPPYRESSRNRLIRQE